jgi:hypothetical protein
LACGAAEDWVYNSINQVHMQDVTASQPLILTIVSPPPQFSAACWHFAEHLTDIMEKNGEPIVPFGLISSQWGGTMVEHWQPNASLNAGVCKNSSGGAYAPSQNQRYENDAAPRPA